MEGALWIRTSRGNLIRGWQKRYFVLTGDGVLKEFIEVDELGGTDQRQRQLAHASGMQLKNEVAVKGASVKTVPFALVGRHNVFQIALQGSFRMALSAKTSELMSMWVHTLKRLTGSPRARTRRASSEAETTRERSPAVCDGIPRHSITTSSLEYDEQSLSLPCSAFAMDDELREVSLSSASELGGLTDAMEWINSRARFRTDVNVASTHISRGCFLVSINGISLQTIGSTEVMHLLKPSKLPLHLRVFPSPYKKGVLKCKLCCSLSTQLKTIAQYRNGLREWKDQIVEIDGDVITCQRVAESKSKTKRVLPLTGECTVKTVHEIVADRKNCFLVSVKGYSMLFQAATQAELLEWIEAIQRAIQIAEGVLPGYEMPFDSLLLQSSQNMRNHQLAEDFTLEDAASTSNVSTDEAEWDASGDDTLESPTQVSTTPFEETTKPVVDPVPLPEEEITDLLHYLQLNGRFVEALQLLAKHSELRSLYWKKIFQWAMDPVDETEIEMLLDVPLHEDDHIQVQKDIPRTSKWLAGSLGSPQLNAETTPVRLERLQRVLHAFLSSCVGDMRTDRSASVTSISGESAAGPGTNKGFYMQGMNGIAFVVLQVLQDDEMAAFQFFRGMISRVLPHVFSISCRGLGKDNFDLFKSLAEVGTVLDEVIQMYLPQFHATLDAAGMPACLLAYKWFPTLFSDVSLTANHSQLRYDTLLAAWDVCLLLGVEGIFCVALALCSTAEEAVLSLGDDTTAEHVSSALVKVLCQIKPEDLTISVCEVLELCSHPVLLKLRNGHRRRLQLGYSPKQTIPVSTTQVSPMMVKDLDSGKMFQISTTGSMLLPARSASSLLVSSR